MMLVAILVIRAISCDLIWWRRNRELIWQIGDSLATSFSIVIDPDRYESRDDDEVNCCQKRQWRIAQTADGKKNGCGEKVKWLKFCPIVDCLARRRPIVTSQCDVCALFCNHLKTATAPRIFTSWSVETKTMRHIVNCDPSLSCHVKTNLLSMHKIALNYKMN